eukprot:scaffold95859_cov25-Cyclotella_meneghiniana.AAC.1
MDLLHLDTWILFRHHRVPKPQVSSHLLNTSRLMCNHCASCGKADANLKACKACKLVKYCGIECQVAHRAAHKKACREKERDLFALRLFAQPMKREDCPICMLILPCSNEESFYMACCGNFICIGCRYCLTREYCPFYNTANPASDEEKLKRLSERIEKYNDPDAMVILGLFYNQGQNSLPVDQSKAFELLHRASELECDGADYNLGYFYLNGLGVQKNRKKAIHHYQIAAMMGNIHARHNLACIEVENRNYQCAMKHLMVAARCGWKDSLDMVKLGFRQGYVTKEDFEKTLRDYQASYDETKSEERDRAVVIIAREQESIAHSHREQE